MMPDLSHMPPGTVTWLSEVDRDDPFEADYLAIRNEEKRIYSDEQLRSLPLVDKEHPHRQEWAIRQKGLERLLEYRRKHPSIKSILDLGCGNGWMSNALARQSGATVIGLDMNSGELQQAASVFQDVAHLRFCYGDIFDDIFPETTFDMIICASSVQYFPDISALLDRLLSLLSDAGEIHILESPFYANADIEAAARRSADYFLRMGFPRLAQHYHHHRSSDLEVFNPEFLYDPATLLQKIRRRLGAKNNSPFPWIRLRSSP